jgi:hypothetical protein
LLLQVDLEEELIPDSKTSSSSEENTQRRSASSADFAAGVVRAIAKVLHNHASNDMQYAFLQSGGVTSLAYLLLRISPHNLTHSLLQALIELTSSLLLHHPNEREPAVVEPLFLNFHLWIYAPADVQRFLFQKVLPPYMAIRPWIRYKFGVEYLLEQMCRYYWEVPSEIALAQQPVYHPITRLCVGRRPEPAQRAELRNDLLHLIDLVMQEAPSLEEVKILLYDTSIQTNHSLSLSLSLSLSFTFTSTLFLHRINSLSGCENIRISDVLVSLSFLVIIS